MSRVGVLPSESLQPPGQSAAGRSRSDLRSSLNSYTNPAYDTARSEEEQLVEQQRSLRQFILANFQRKECCLFEAKDGKKCACGEVREKHDGLLPAGPEEKWNEATHMRRSVTNAYGRITLKNEGFDNRDPIHFARVCDEDSMDKMLELMKTHWQLADPQKPSLCISVIGGAKNFKLEGRKKEVFHHGLIRAAQTTNAWIITSGLNLGITRVVGNALEEGRASHWEKSSRSSKLRCTSGWRPGLRTEPGPPHQQTRPKIGPAVSLNAQHTHYLLVDDGKRNRRLGHLRGDAEHDPVQHPVVTCDNTGRAADIIAFAYKKYKKPTKRLCRRANWADLRERMISTFQRQSQGPKTKKVNDKKVRRKHVDLTCWRSCRRQKLITVFDMNRSDDLDLAHPRLDDYKQQLQLSMTWNRPDIAAEKIFTEEHQWGTENLDKFALSAISQEKIEFLRLFLKNGLIMRGVPDCGPPAQPLQGEPGGQQPGQPAGAQAAGGPDPLPEPVGADPGGHSGAAAEAGGKFHAPSMDKDVGTGGDDEQFERPFNQLFFWAVLLCKQDTAKFLWERTDESVPLALAASKRVQRDGPRPVQPRGRAKADAAGLQRRIRELAVHVVRECQMVGPSKAELLIEKKVEAFGDFNCLELAASANCKKFVSCNSSQNSITSRWLNGLMHGTSNLRIFLCVVLPFLLPFEFLVRVEPSVRLDEGGRCAQLAHKVRIYYTAPVTKFFANAIWYVIFIFLYSWFILFEMKAASISWLEWVIIAWICVMVVEEIREMFSSKRGHGPGEAARLVGFSAWNRLDLFTMLLALIGIFLRIPRPRTPSPLECRTCYILAGLYYANSYLVQSWVMIQKMVKELLFYMSILIVALLTYGVAAQALLYPTRDFTTSIFVDIVYYPLLADLRRDLPGSGRSTVDSSGKLCPTHHSLVLLLLAVYLMVVNVLLINLLIAIFRTVALAVVGWQFSGWQFFGWQFSRLAIVGWQLSAGSCRLDSWAVVGWQLSAGNCRLAVFRLAVVGWHNIFKEIQNNSVEIWKFNMYFLVHEYPPGRRAGRCRSSSWRMCSASSDFWPAACPAAARER
uniref:LSDAT_euk domain-containing protein n=1 Tax=Macrostomum lignano TaxID=282301 RepID=A0A1I8F1N6_9PLAT